MISMVFYVRSGNIFVIFIAVALCIVRNLGSGHSWRFVVVIFAFLSVSLLATLFLA